MLQFSLNICYLTNANCFSTCFMKFTLLPIKCANAKEHWLMSSQNMADFEVINITKNSYFAYHHVLTRYFMLSIFNGVFEVPMLFLTIFLEYIF
jgi:hypothetical protein